MRIGYLSLIWMVIFSGAPALEKKSYGGINVIYFLSPGCTICQFYTLRMREFSEKYRYSGVAFHGVFSSSLCNETSIEEFKLKYLIPFEISCDSSLHEKFHATVTPEVFVVDVSGEVLYSGRIDDSYAAIGKRRPKAKHHELRDAIDAILKGDTVKIIRTEPVGCIIQK